MAEEVTPEVKQQRIREFMQVLPLTLEIAGLPEATLERLMTNDQMEARVSNLKMAYKHARQLLREVSEG